VANQLLQVASYTVYAAIQGRWLRM